MGERLRASLPNWREIFFGGPLWGLMMAISALVALYLRNGAETSHLFGILVLFFCGGLVSWPCALFLARFGAMDRGRETRFAAFFVCLTICTIAGTAFLFAMDYRLFYTRWHAPFGTRTWAYQFTFTSASAVYQFVVMGIRLYLPLGFAALGLTSLWLACRPPEQQR
ncbi:hypothetical protein OIU34_01345 [Pararhizobium sp. BT-229]|uniref:hypothetical protein n=1 Tax=Pararhizobium sp. BT-229 TaxID=2986923 RepID=UPI0021F6FA27|nr:hypothetical protein [Pararhizobium sp. BT-229]MCV9960527.1 hypothetical protein [Pararhizobium sp. BT-229]